MTGFWFVNQMDAEFPIGIAVAVTVETCERERNALTGSGREKFIDRWLAGPAENAVVMGEARWEAPQSCDGKSRTFFSLH